MKQLHFFRILVFFILTQVTAIQPLSAQCGFSFMLTTQADVDSFNINHGCTTVHGNIEILGNNITSLDSLYRLDSIIEGLIIHDCDNLTSLAGLENVRYVGNTLEIEDNDRLKNLAGLEGLQVLDEIELFGNDSLNDLSDLDSFLFIRDFFYIKGNPQLNACGVYWICNMALCQVSHVVEENGPECYSGGFGLLGCPCTVDLNVPLDVTISRQSDLDRMWEKYRSCPFMLESLRIEDSTITSLDSLGFLEYIGSSLQLFDTDSLTSLTGLEKLTYVEDFFMVNNAGLVDISAVDSNIFVRDYLAIQNNDSLESCRTPWVCRVLDKIENYQITGNKGDCAEVRDVLPYCPCVTEMNYVDYTLTSQTDVDSLPFYVAQCSASIRHLKLSGNTILNLDSLDGITQIFGDLVIDNCDRLKNLQGLDNLLLIGKKFTIQFNDSLMTLSGLENLVSIQDEFIIDGNPFLTSISELDSFLNIGGTLELFSNSSLGICNVHWVCNHLAKGRQVSIGSNGSGCNNFNEVRENCICVAPNVESSFTLTTQGEVDSFPFLLNQCGFKVDRFVLFGPGIKNLDSLYILDSINGWFDIVDCDSLLSLNGLQNLVFIDGRLRLDGNQRLNDISALNSNLMIESLLIRNNDSLNNCAISGLCNIINIDFLNEIIIENNGPDCSSPTNVVVSCVCNSVVDTINVFLNTQTAVDSFGRALRDCDFTINRFVLRFKDDDPIVNLDSLIYLDSIYGSAFFGRSFKEDTFPPLNGLQNLKYIGGDLSMSQLEIADLSDFSGLTYIGEYFEIGNMDSLISMDGLDSTIFIAGNVDIYSNKNLVVCAVPWMCNYLKTSKGKVVVNDMAGSCSDPMNLIADCGCPNPITSRFEVHLETQTEVDNFPAFYNTCPFRIDDLEIELDTDHPGYDQYQAVKDPVISLDSLYIIDSVWNDLEVKGMKRIVNLHGLHNIKYVGDDLEIEENLNLEDMTALSAINYTGEDVDIEDNPNLLTLNGLQGLSYLSASLDILRNEGLTSLVGLENLVEIVEELDIVGNTSLTDLTALSNLQAVGEMSIRNNLNLATLDGFENLSNITLNDAEIQIDNNPKLGNISALSGISSKVSELLIAENPKLSPCNLGWICDHISSGRQYLICLNDTGCANAQEVIAACSCEENLILSDPDGLFRAKNMISTSGNQIMMQYGVYDAPNVLLDKGFEVPKGTSLWVLSKGCE